VTPRVAEIMRRFGTTIRRLHGRPGSASLPEDVAVLYEDTRTGKIRAASRAKGDRPIEATPDLLTITAELTAAQVKALRASPATIVPAGGAGTMIEFVSAVLLLDYETVVYALGAGDDLAFKYANGAGASVSLIGETTGFLDQAADVAKVVTALGSPFFTKAQCENQAIVLHNIGAAEVLNGDSSLLVHVSYHVRTTGW